MALDTRGFDQPTLPGSDDQVNTGHLLLLQQTAHEIAGVTLYAGDVRGVGGCINKNLHDFRPTEIAQTMVMFEA